MKFFRLIFLTIAILANTIIGAPNDYWQQDIHYTIKVELNTEEHTLTGHETLRYTNNSPDELHHVWLHLYPNAFRDDNSVYARERKAAQSTGFLFSKKKDRGYIEIQSLRAGEVELQRSEKPDDGTELKVTLDKPLLPGATVQFEIDFFVKIPHIFSRLGHIGRHYEMTQWYPKMVVYDKYGWHPDGYHYVGEFYGEFSTFDVEITLPADMVVAATGILVGPEEEKQWMKELAAQGARLDSLRAAGEKGNGKKIKKLLKEASKREESDSTKTLYFHADKVHDFAWATDGRFILKRGKYKDVDINVFVLPKHEQAWKDVIEYVRDTMKYYGQWFMEYPHPQQSIVDGDISAGGGMEYPMLTIISMAGPPWMRFLEMVVMHETGHNWFYGILGSNEMAEAWLDEGMNTFAEVRYMESKYGKTGNFFNWPKKLKFMPAFGEHWYQTLSYYINATTKTEVPVLTPAYQIPITSYSGTAYSKGGNILEMLAYLVGEENFDEIMHTYFDEWKFKHPHTDDFIQVAEKVSGQKLDWFFDQWLREVKKCDLRIAKISTQQAKQKGQTKQQCLVSIENRGKAQMPADVLVETVDGQHLVQRWNGQSDESTLVFDVDSKPKSVWIDPDDKILEVNNWNNRKPRALRFRPYFDFPPFDKHLILYGANFWYDDDKDGARPGIFLNGGNFRNLGPIPGFHQWRVGASYGIRSNKWNYQLAYNTNVIRARKFYNIAATAKDIEGRFRSLLLLKARFARSPFFRPFTLFEMGHSYSNIYDIEYRDRRDWSQGKVSAIHLGLTVYPRGLRLQTQFAVKAKIADKTLGSDFNSTSLEATVHFRYRPTKKLLATLRIIGGTVNGTPALQERHYLFGGMELDGFFSSLADGKGRLSPQDHLQVSGGGGMRGYYGQHLAGKAIAAANLDVHIPNLPLRFFFDAGNVWDAPDMVEFTDLSYDAGLSLNLGLVLIHFPIWVSQPMSGEKKFKFRWLVSISSSFSLAL